MRSIFALLALLGAARAVAGNVCAEDCNAFCKSEYRSGSYEMMRDSCLAGCKLPNAAKATTDDVDTHCRTPFLPGMDQDACKKGAQAVRRCSAALPTAVAAAAAPIQCAGGQKAVYGAHPGCEAGTCKNPTPLCQVIVTDWHCVCEEGQLFDSSRSACVAAETESCVVQHAPSSMAIVEPEGANFQISQQPGQEWIVQFRVMAASASPLLESGSYDSSLAAMEELVKTMKACTKTSCSFMHTPCVPFLPGTTCSGGQDFLVETKTKRTLATVSPLSELSPSDVEELFWKDAASAEVYESKKPEGAYFRISHFSVLEWVVEFRMATSASPLLESGSYDSSLAATEELVKTMKACTKTSCSFMHTPCVPFPPATTCAGGQDFLVETKTKRTLATVSPLSEQTPSDVEELFWKDAASAEVYKPKTSSGAITMMAAPSSGIQCGGGQKAAYGAHAGCEEKTCKDPAPLCEVVLTGWHCVCEGAGHLFDGMQGSCVAADADGCVAQREITITV